MSDRLGRDICVQSKRGREGRSRKELPARKWLTEQSCCRLWFEAGYETTSGTDANSHLPAMAVELFSLSCCMYTFLSLPSSPHFSRLGWGKLVISLMEVICSLSHTEASRVLLAACLFLSLLTSSVCWGWGGGVSWGILLSGHLVFQAAEKSFPGNRLSHRSESLLESSGFVGCPVTARKEYGMIWDSARLLALLGKIPGRARGLARYFNSLVGQG